MVSDNHDRTRAAGRNLYHRNAETVDGLAIPTAPNSFIHGDEITVTYEFFRGTVAAASRPETVTITALGKHLQKMAKLVIETLK